MKRNRTIVPLVLCLLGAALAPLPAEAASDLERAREAFATAEWRQAADSYAQALAGAAEESGNDWFQYGFALYFLERDEEALEAYEQARTRGFESARLLGTSAIALARLGRRDDALETLRAAVEAGMPVTRIVGDAALETLASDPRHAEIVRLAEDRTYPCKRDPQRRQFDFWAGDWDVYANGVLTGRNRISIEHQGCVLVERYETVNGAFTGTSFNYLDGETGRWHQLWIAQGGTVTRYEGGFEDGAMRLEGFSSPASGARQRVRMTFTPQPNGDVRQLIESYSHDSGEWSVGFDGTYVRREDEGEDS